jgi:hypothetical protein
MKSKTSQVAKPAIKPTYTAKMKAPQKWWAFIFILVIF